MTGTPPDPMPIEPEPRAPEADAAPIEVSAVYRASPRYWILAVAALGATAVLLFDIVTTGLRWDSALFAAIGLLGGLWALWMATTRVLVTDDGLIIQRFTAMYKIDHQQLLRADVQGRFLGVLSLIYHPRLENGLIDTDQVGSMLVPALVDQQALIERLESRLPR